MARLGEYLLSLSYMGGDGLSEPTCPNLERYYVEVFDRLKCTLTLNGIFQIHQSGIVAAAFYKGVIIDGQSGNFDDIKDTIVLVKNPNRDRRLYSEMGVHNGIFVIGNTGYAAEVGKHCFKPRREVEQFLVPLFIRALHQVNVNAISIW